MAGGPVQPETIQLSAQLRRAELEALYEAAPAGLGVFDRELVCLRANLALARMLGFSAAEEMAGRSLQTIWQGAVEQAEAIVAEVLRSGAPVRDRVVQTRSRTGELQEWRLHVLPLFDGEAIAAFSAIVQDVTAQRRAEEALRASRERWIELADSMPQLVWTALPDGVVDYYNKRRQEFSGITASGDAYEWAPVLHPDDVPATMAAWEHALATGETYEIEHRVQHQDGNYYWYLSRGLPVRDETGAVTRWYGTATLIHKQKVAQLELQASEERLAVAQEAAGNGVWEWDLRDNTLYWGPRTYEIFGIPDGEPMTFARFLASVHPEDRERVVASLQGAWAQRTDWQGEFRVVHPRNGIRWVEGYGRTRFDAQGRPVRTVGLNVDVTWRRQAEAERERLVAALAEEQQELRRLNEELEERVRQRTMQVRNLSRELTLAEQQERRRVAQILHDEVQQMLVYLQMHLNQVRVTSGEEPVREALEVAETIVLETLQMTGDLSDDLGVGPLAGRERLRDALTWLAEMMSQRYQLRVHVQAPAERVMADTGLRMLVVRLVQELLFNVVKHAGVSEAEVRVEAGGGWVTVTVADEGNGFSTEGAATGLPSLRSGFGLASIDERLQLFGGRMELQSAPGAGTRVTLWVPAGPETT
jgi:PAS domain S-box-containing protein